jgi:16S rRNA (guanine527-N7)-methyltransferase
VDIPSLLRPYTDPLSPTQLDQVSTYIDLLLRWNARMNLTAIRDPEQIITRHFGESFFLSRVLSFRAQRGIPPANAANSPDHQLTRSADNQIARYPDVLDLGSGAGFPAIPLKILNPNVTITLIEAQQRKATFLREVLRALHLDAEVKNVRAETLPPASADIVTLRAVEKFDQTLPTAARLVPASTPNVDAVRPRAAEPDSTVHRPSNLTSGLALLISSAQVARAQGILPNWRFYPQFPVPNSQNRVIQLIEPNQ